ncbi:Protein of unknown function [Pyronema omphalodes CBS 100304]|uniref:Uncharacterized protein n=1 Tax=Pyronema omphalodes (strain CBS 100304) TaxID=1076935 RepID=U4KW63_PYROM|nr:Protein of unknown function [Pyronema omphalodes CBS 100304]
MMHVEGVYGQEVATKLSPSLGTKERTPIRNSKPIQYRLSKISRYSRMHTRFLIRMTTAVVKEQAFHLEDMNGMCAQG